MERESTTPAKTLVRAGVLGLALALAGCAAGQSDQQAADAKAAAVARVTILEPEDNAEIQGTSVMIMLSTDNIEIAPVADGREGTGHHHLFVNAPVIPGPGEPIPAGVPGIIHLGLAQTSYELTDLTPGEYTVISVIGDLVHRRIEPQVMDTVRFRVR